MNWGSIREEGQYNYRPYLKSDHRENRRKKYRFTLFAFKGITKTNRQNYREKEILVYHKEEISTN